MAAAGTSRVTVTGHGVPSARLPRSATAATSAARMKPASGANAPDSSISRSASCSSSGVHAGHSASSGGSPEGPEGPADTSAITFTSVRPASTAGQPCTFDNHTEARAWLGLCGAHAHGARRGPPASYDAGEPVLRLAYHV